MVTSSGSNLETLILAHASLMLIAWGWLLPSGVIFAKMLKHRPNGTWFTFHKILQPLGLVVAIAGWSIALRNFNTLKDVGAPSYRHAVCGMTVMIGGLLQPLNAIFRPPPPEPEDTKMTTRLIWEIVHKGLGWVTILLALATIALGTTILPTVDQQRTFQIAFGAGCGGLLFLLIAALLLDSKHYKPTEETKDAKELPVDDAEKGE
jgi:hypothetical protein